MPNVNTSWREWIFPPRTDLTDDLTTYDWLKTAAIVLMIIDHVGYFMFPDIEWFRVFGRLCAPIFFFLIGYAQTRDISMRWLVASGILLVSSMMFGLPVLPLCILVTMLLIRLALNPLMGWLEGHAQYLWWVVLLLIFAMIPTDMFVEYGTMGLVLAISGFAVRHREAVAEVFGDKAPQWLMGVALGSYGILSAAIFGFTFLADMVLAGGLIGLFFVLQNFKGEVIEGSASHPHAALIRFCGRYTLEIYVIHLLILKAYFALGEAARIVANMGS